MEETCLFFLICVCLSVIVIPGIKVHAAAKINSWDLVDSGKHLDYDGNSKYMSYIKSGANSTISFDEKTQNIDTQKELAKTEEVQQYENAVDNQILTEDNNLNSDFDASQEQ
ncbi:hypothetical protein GSY37_04490 [Listeria monocytogenes]|nr:hypothetical protein [Listeria monocytogenes]